MGQRLLCIHTIGKRDDRFSYIDHGANLSGLSREKIIASERDVSVVVTDDDIRQAPVEYREALAGNVGRPVCSVLTELQVLSQKSSEDLPVQPAVSFVSMASGLLAAAELVKYSLGLPSPLETFFQMDFLYPLLNALLQPVDKVKSCYCVVRGGDIDTYRRAVE